MSKPQRATPLQSVERLIQRFHVLRPPVQIDEIIRSMGVEVRHVPLEEELSGMIFFNGHVPIIVVNSIHPSTRQRFTLAHELGHHLLHQHSLRGHVHVDKKYSVMARDAKSARGLDLKEIEANRFAAELLVPRALLKKAIRGRILDIEDEGLVAELAKEFQVSRQMMAIRLGELSPEPER